MRGQRTAKQRHSVVTPQIARLYEVRPRRDRCGFDLISDQLPFGRLWYVKVGDAIGYAQFFSRSHDAVIRNLR